MRFIPVKYKKKWLTPCRFKRAKQLVKRKQAVFFQDKIYGLCIRLKKEPSEYDESKKVTYTLGLDRGTQFTGITLLSDKDVVNIELYNHKPDIDLSVKSSNRRIRRSRLRHRKCRFSNRTGNKINNTSNYYYQLITSILKKLSIAYNIKEVNVEDIRYNHYYLPDGGSFSNLEVGKNKLYRYLSDNYNLNLFNGSDTSNSRKLIFGKPIYEKVTEEIYDNELHGYSEISFNRIIGHTDVKNSDKSIKDFNSHCIDSFILANITRGIYNSRNIEDINKHVIFLTPIRHIRRLLTQFKNKIGNKCYYFRYGKNGKIKYIDHYSKLKKIRVKINDNKSNHGPWNYMYINRISTYKKFISNYGGTIVKGQSRSELPRGYSKYWNTYYKQYTYHDREFV